MIGRTEVVAVYVEERIRAYGFEVQTGLSLVTRAAGQSEAIITNADLPSGAPDAMKLRMAVAQANRDGDITLQLLLDAPGPPTLGDLSQAEWLPGEGPILEYRHPVDAVWFHGPHFGDRHGIATAALGALQHGAVPILCASMVGASVFLVLPPGQGEPAVAWLRVSFTVPTSRSTAT